ncbi:meichroacidin, putative [Trichomonas vaginalis G3]|uniref:Meichroacidin, putative n=1 Tax=Trichomonas vaginalis (strain ATCC PRA-98 / G3) TaxID=412133 RepID=A2EQG5_TRIV3|nr:MORN repeat-containing protein family [Trichomonas vaginalis G3]EAY05107.1 meichroacidin, putative [Trichomonas vaginalis G3]KAI5551463.1 MORN repeat-containing protein family [Trichomonas vaginalis G3]|eukprot:XP_001317330.1 meichroacidin [Trichomonas vaginalis G3]
MGDEEEDQLDIGVYEGERDEAGQRSGYGKMIFSNGDIYEGMYLNGMRNGKGRYTWKKGGMYEGEYVNHKRQGFGIMHYPDNSTYQGIWFENWRHGKGIYTYPNGDTYEGDWQYGRRHGHGVYTVVSDGSVFEGEYRRGRRHGVMKWTTKHGLVYTGVFQNDQPLGRAKWEVQGKTIAQHGEYAQIDGEIEEEEANEEQPEEDVLDEVVEPEEEKPKKVLTKWKPDVELNNNFDELNTKPTWYLRAVEE